VVVAVVAVGMVEVVGDQIVDVVAVRDGLMTASRAVGVPGVVARTGKGVFRSAVLRVRATNLDCVLVDMVLVRVMQVTVVQIVHMSLVADGHVAAVRTVLVCVVLVNLVPLRGHGVDATAIRLRLPPVRGGP
jgi:hypothetical protein